MNTEFFDALDALEKEKGIPKEYMLERVEAALVSAYKRESGGNTNIKIILNPEKKEVKVFEEREIVEQPEDKVLQISLEEALKISKHSKLGGVCEIEVKPKNFGRLSAQTAKQVIIQSIREAERGMMIKEYESKKEEIISALVLKIDPETGNATVDTGTSIATLIKTEQIPGDNFTPGERIKVYVMEVKKETKGPIVSLSRKDPGFVKRLFELEIPEIHDGTVIIKAICREAGSRTKIAVYSRDENVDPIGACIGNKGMRISEILKELCGEKIDIVKYSEEPEQFITAALSPANVRSIVMDSECSCRAYVDDDQLSLAIGKEGQNARLAARLTGFKIDIKKESDAF